MDLALSSIGHPLLSFPSTISSPLLFFFSSFSSSFHPTHTHPSKQVWMQSLLLHYLSLWV